MLYPTSSPVSPSSMRVWLDRCPGFGGAFFDDSCSRLGVFLCAPLSAGGWNRFVLRGEVTEGTLESNDLFDGSGAVGVHLYHIEKILPDPSGISGSFVDRVLREIGSAIPRTTATSICGFSALAASRDGCDLLSGRLNCRELGKLVDEHVFIGSGGSVVVVEGLTQSKLHDLQESGLRYSHRCKLFALLPEHPSVVWEHIRF